MAVGKRIRQVRIAAGLTQQQIADQVGVTKSSVAQWEGGQTKHLRGENLLKVAQVLNVDPDWLISGRGNALQSNVKVSFRRIIAWESPDDLPDGQYIFVPRSFARFSAGSGELFFEDVEGPALPFTTQWIKSRNLYRSSLILVDAKGDSMQPRIHDGDILLVNRRIDSNFEDGKIYVIRYGDELCVKRLYHRYDGSWIIRSDNRERYPDETIPRDSLENIELLGRVVWIAGAVD